MAPESRLRRLAGWTWDFACWTLLLLGAAVLILAVLAPRITGSTPYTITTGSMSPTYPPGTLVIVKPVSADELEVGDAITYQLESGKAAVVTHRITSIGTSLRGDYLFETQGDANDVVDEKLVLPAQLKGKVTYGVPFVGHVAAGLTGEDRWRINYLLAGLLALYSLSMFGSYLLGRRKAKDEVLDSPRPVKPARKFKLKLSSLIPAHLGLARVAFTLVMVIGLVGLTTLPSGAFWRSAAIVSGTMVTSKTVTPPSSTTPYCTVWNTGKNREENGTSCTVALSAAGCSNSWSTAANVYLRFETQGVKINGSNNWGNDLTIRFAANLQALGCNPPGISWAAPTKAGLSSNASFTFAPTYRCEQLPMVEASINYYGAGTNTHLGTLHFDRTGKSVSCAA